MDTVKDMLFTLLRSGLKGETVTVGEPFPFEEIVGEATRHGVENILFYGLRAAGFTVKDPRMKALLHTVGESIFVNENQVATANSVCEAFEKNGIAYMPLKGLVLRDMYPAAEMRTMGDVDILIKTEQYPAICEILRSLGFTSVLESVYELVWQKDGVLYLELHKSLFPTYDTDFYAEFGDGWDRAARQGDTCRYALSLEDTFVYLLTHFAKHYLDGGIGFRHLADLWVYLQAHPDLDTARMLPVLERLHLRAFYENVVYALSVWMEDAPITPAAAAILHTVWASGVYGTAEDHRIAGAERHTVTSASQMKRRHFLSFMFPPFELMSYAYPVLKKAPFLLPFVYIWRFITKALLRPKQVLQRSKDVITVTEDDVKNRQEALRLVGLLPAADRKYV